MDFNVNILFTKPYYKWVQNVPIQTIDVYYKFINWVAGEFNLHLQEETSGLKVYYPGGWFCIKNIKQFERNDNIEIIIMSKSKKACEKKGIQLVSIYNQIIKIYALNPSINLNQKDANSIIQSTNIIGLRNI